MDFLEFLKSGTVYLDGGMGTQLQARGLGPGEKPETWNLTHPDVIVGVHKAYFDAGSNVVSANTFGANLLKFSAEELERIIKAALCSARAARAESTQPGEKFIALDIGPSGKLIEPLGDLAFEDAVALFAETVKLGVRYGAELIVIETMSDCHETKAALLAAKENSNLPVLVTNAYGESGKLMTGASPAAMAAMLEGMGADAIGANCSLGPKQLRPVALELLENASVPVILKPNAGLPKTVDGKTVYDVTPEEFAAEVKSLMEAGVRVVGGCCGTTPEYIRTLYDATCGMTAKPLTDKGLTVISSSSHAAVFGDVPVLIGSRICPAADEEIAGAMAEGDTDTLLDEGFEQQDAGAAVLLVDVGAPEADEAALLPETVGELQSAIRIPLMIGAADAAAMEAALRRYNGKAAVRLADRAAMEEACPILKKYGGTAVVPICGETAEECLRIAEETVEAAEAYGIRKKDILLEMPASAETVRLVREKVGCAAVVSILNAAELDALPAGAVMLDPLDDALLAAYEAFAEG